ncbi:2-hydroxychromene-2-carboxylate isomerase (plasmid) [Streptomyces sp. NBC_01351]|uniref:2-hydroxychromene-2-carboxylate isomerase n=1 Tax=Streptomyces sp. NBC_01351 TaxID=2903833 RepID=UPI002E35445A|nr:2-hydroxychromene-2-carboxylate isomerase [Streptomyces sp. NBC_01351]
MPKNKTPRFYFSLRSPYSWLAYREITTFHPDLAEQLEWVPFFEPDETSSRLLTEQGGRFPYSAMSREKNRYVLQDVGRLTKARGLTVTWPVDREPVWEVPHLAYLVAARQGRGHAFIDAVYRARFGRGQNICDPATIEDIAFEIGLDPRELAGASEDPEVRAEGIRALLDVCRDGVFGVPFFVHGFSRFWGIDRLDEFIAHLRDQQVPAASVPEPLAAIGLGDRATEDAHAGGCG